MATFSLKSGSKSCKYLSCVHVSEKCTTLAQGCELSFFCS